MTYRTDASKSTFMKGCRYSVIDDSAADIQRLHHMIMKKRPNLIVPCKGTALSADSQVVMPNCPLDCSPRGLSATIAIALAMLVLCLRSPEVRGSENLPPWQTCQSAVQKVLRDQPGYQNGDLLSRSTVKSVLLVLREAGWHIDKEKVLMELTLPDNDFLAVQFRTKKGAEFMRHISKLELAYDRLDRLTNLDFGRKTVLDLIRGPDGHKLIEYYTSTAKRGNSITEILPKGPSGKSPAGKKFNEPTGRIYTETHLLAQLKQFYLEELNAKRNRTEESKKQ